MKGNLCYINIREGETKMEKLTQDVVTEVTTTSSVCPIVKKALPIAAPVAVVVGAVLMVRHIWKKRAVKKVANSAVEETVEVNPAE